MIFAKKDVVDWHRWFAWHPVWIASDGGRWVWFEYVERKFEPSPFPTGDSTDGGSYEYRQLPLVKAAQQ